MGLSSLRLSPCADGDTGLPPGSLGGPRQGLAFLSWPWEPRPWVRGGPKDDLSG